MKAYIIVDLGYGDAGKGTTVDFLSRLTPNTLIVRYNGGPQAGHNVVTAEGVHHTFAQFGSGTLVPSVKTYLSKYMWIEPLALLAENEGLERKGVTDALSRLFIDKDTQIVTPFHRLVSRIKESARKHDKHGSCGMGVGEAVSDSLQGLSLTVESLHSPEASLRILKDIQEKKVEESKFFVGEVLSGEDNSVLYDSQAPQLCYDIYRHLFEKVMVVEGEKVRFTDYDQVIFEGAGGILLDENYGFHPHTMWTTTTTRNARELWPEEATTLGIVRTYSTRHGPGPFVSEEAVPFVDSHNLTNIWQGWLRTGAFDLVATKYALKANGGVDALVITHTDEPYPRMCDAYSGMSDSSIMSVTPNYLYDVRTNELVLPTNREEQERLTHALFNCKPHIIKTGIPIDEISDRLGLPVFIESFGAKSCDKKLVDSG